MVQSFLKKRAHLHSLKLSGEAASADTRSAPKFPDEFAKLIEEGGYVPQQIFNVDETGLFWKKMPARTFISMEEKTLPGHKASKDRFTLLLGGNASGDFKLKPLIVYKSENQRAFKGKNKALLPVIWRSNKAAWVTGAIFQDWFTNHFVPAVKDYLKRNNLAMKCVLVLDNAPGHPRSVGDIFPEFEVTFLPPNTTSLLQPMDQTVIATFKRYYTRRSP